MPIGFCLDKCLDICLDIFSRMNQLYLASWLKWSSENFAYGFAFTFYRNKPFYEAPFSKPEEDLTPCENAVLEQIKLNVKATRSELSERLGKSEKAIQRLQASLAREASFSSEQLFAKHYSFPY